MNKGKFITIGGPDTAGKTTVINRLKHLLPSNYLFTREPGNLLNKNNKSEDIRVKLLSDKSFTVEEQTKLFAESRYYHTLEILEELNKGNNVITDRYLYSSLVYQGNILGVDTVLEYNKKSIDLLLENDIDIHNIVLQISEETYKERMSGKVKDAMEDIDNEIALDRVRGYNNIINLGFTLGSIYTIDANTLEDKVKESVVRILNNIMGV